MRLWAVAFLLLPLLGQTYISWRIWHLLPLSASWRMAAVVLALMALAAFILTFIAPIDKWPFGLSAAVYQTGASWLFVMLYLVMVFLLLDLLRLIHVVPSHWLTNNARVSMALAAFMVGLFTYAYFNYQHKQRIAMTIDTEKQLAKPLKIVMMTDLHLGYINRVDEFRRWVDLVNREKPDLILIAGDIIDRGLRAVEVQDMTNEFHRLQAPIYACLGNHEYYSDEKGCQLFYEKAGIHLLRDESVLVQGIRLVGRDDRTNAKRKALSAFVQKDDSLYTILMDHQPYHLEEAEQASIDFQLSGHTHYGQVWPVSWIEDHLYECAFGEHHRGATRYYVSSGIGIWGAKFRIGTRSEYLVLDLI